MNKFTGFLSYMKPFDETLIVRSVNLVEDNTVLNDEFDEAVLKAAKEFFPNDAMLSKTVLIDETFVRILTSIEARTVRGFQLIVTPDLSGVDLYKNMPLNDFAINLFIRYKLSPSDPILNVLPGCLIVNIPYATIDQYANTITPV